MFLQVGWQESDVFSAVGFLRAGDFWGILPSSYSFHSLSASKILSYYTIKDATSCFKSGLYFQSQTYDYFYFLFLSLQLIHINTQESSVWQEIPHSG